MKHKDERIAFITELFQQIMYTRALWQRQRRPNNPSVLQGCQDVCLGA